VIRFSTRHSERVLNFIVFIAAIFGLSGCRPEGSEDLRVVGVDGLGREQSIPLSARLMASRLSRTMRELDRTTLTAIEVQSGEQGFELSRVTVGLELEFETEIEGLMELGIEGVFEMRYQPLPVSRSL
jgi:hypothetical protein